jgi:hypothetical protein
MTGHGSDTRRGRQTRPGLEGLERRDLLSGTAAAAGQGGAAAEVNPAQSSGSGSNASSQVPRVRQIRYTTPQGTHVAITLYGVGTLYGTTVDPDGGLNLRFSGTSAQTGIVAKVHGGTGYAPLRTLQHRLVPAQSLSGIGSSLLNVVNLRKFDLVSGGRINLTGGVHILFLNSVAPDTQVSLRQTPPQLLPNGSTTAGSNTTASENGVNLAFLTDLTGAQTLTGVSGTVVPGFNLLAAGTSPLTPATNAVPQAAPPGVIVSINHVNGPPRGALLLGTPQVFAYDTKQNALIRFDTTTGEPTLTIPKALPTATAGTDAGVALARVNTRTVVLIDDGSDVYAYNPLDGSFLGSFTLNSLKSEQVGLGHPSRIGTVDSYTVVSNPNGGPDKQGVIQAINVGSSLAVGAAVASGPAFFAQRGFGLSGGLTGVPGSSTLYAVGAATFDPFQPLQPLLGLSSLTPSVPSQGTPVTFTETARNALTNQGALIPTGPNGQQPTTANDALGSVNEFLALGTGRTTLPNGLTVNQVTLYSPTNYTSQANILLDDPNPLSALSGSLRPQLAGAALVDVQGNTQSFRAFDAQGLVFNGGGYINLMKINDASDTTVLGLPFQHAEIPHRSNVTIFSSTRAVGGRNGVTVLPNAQPTGPLSLP